MTRRPPPVPLLGKEGEPGLSKGTRTGGQVVSWLRPLGVAFGLLTRLPLTCGTASDDDLGRAPMFFPVVGFGLGIILAILVVIVGRRPSAALVAVILVACLAALTGGLHLDGLADVFDGLGSAHGDRERALAIMRDSRIGAHGAVAVTLGLLAKAVALSALVERHAVWPIVAFPAVARWTAVYLLAFFPYVRPEGLGQAFHAGASIRQAVWATVFVAALGVWCGSACVIPIMSALAAALAFGVWMQRRLGGLTGDVYGAAIELAEIAFLSAAIAGW